MIDFDIVEPVAADVPPARVVKPEQKPRSRPRSSTKQEIYIQSIKDSLEDELNDVGVVVSTMGFTTAGYVAIDGSQAFSNAVVELARDRPRVLKALEKTGQGAKLSVAVKYIMALVIAVMVDMGTRDPGDFLAGFLGVSTAYQKTHPEGYQEGFVQPNFQPPPSFG